MPDASPFRKIYSILLIPCCTLLTFLVLYLFRFADDNRLTSWKWSFAGIDVAWFILMLVFGLVAAYAASKFSYYERRPVISLFIFSFAASAFFWKAPEVIVDVSRYFSQAKHLELYGIRYFIKEWGGTIDAWTDLPLVPFLYGLLFKVFGESRVYIQVFTTFLFSMTVVLTYFIGRTLWDERTGFCAGVLLLGIPYIFSQIPLMLVDVSTMFFLTLSIFAFIRAMECGGLWVLFSSIALFCAVFAKYSTWMMLSVLGIIFLVYGKQGSGIENQTSGVRNRIIQRGLLIFLTAGLLIGIAFLIKSDVIFGQITFLKEYQAPGLRRWGESFVSTFLYQIHPFITAAALGSIFVAFRKRDLRFLIIAWLIVLVVVFQIKRSRYVLIIFPMYTLMASYGLQTIRSLEIKRYIISCIVASSIIVAAFSYLPFLQSMAAVNFKNAGRYLNSVDAATVEVFTLPSKGSAVNPAIAVPILDLFTDTDIVYRYDGSYTMPFEKVKESPLRFTWEYKNPAYYNDECGVTRENGAVAVITNGPVAALPEYIEEKIRGYQNKRVFDTSTGLFRYSPVVTVYVPAEKRRQAPY